ncbi:spore germination protein [Siminovitchia acidinfaciens]|uniref:Spore germination protein n=1 Tax=Siminovitchia acidinfaciens TaxID=2321395 RepID=A0A429XZX6_9BACI|nr:spore germination protein [Siminovitchia acidinfaciens]RST74317.1 spore germination protein [Siminovitchia acidinfaciens]
MRKKIPIPSVQSSSETIEWVESRLKSFDFVHKPLKIHNKRIMLLYIKTVVDGQRLQESIIKPFFEMSSIEDLEAYFSSLPNQMDIESKEQILLELTKGSVLIHINDSLLLFDFNLVSNDNVLESNIEPTIQGPQYALSEALMTNLNLIRQRYHQPSLTIEMFTIGKKSNQSLALIYDQDGVHQNVLEKVKQRIDSLDRDIVQSTSELLFLINNKRFSLFPNMMMTERTDRIVYNIAGGKAVLLLDGDSNAIIAPAVFFDFMTSIEDSYHTYWVAKFAIMLRYIGLFICLILPGLYVAVISYNPDVFRTELALSIAGSRIGVPYPSYIEVLFMLFVMELLTEASIRLPKAVSATATTVGGLILGTAATEAALSSNVMIIIVSAVAISTFVIPINEMSLAIRVFRYVILFFSTVSGMAGLMLSLIGFIMYLTNKRSFGEPYLKFFFKGRKEEIKRNET